MHYNERPTSSVPFTVILRAHILSVRAPQLRYIVRGTKGTYLKYGFDVQEDQLKAISSPNVIFEDQYGREPEYLYGSLEHIEADDLTITQST